MRERERERDKKSERQKERAREKEGKRERVRKSDMKERPRVVTYSFFSILFRLLRVFCSLIEQCSTPDYPSAFKEKNLEKNPIYGFH